MRRMKIVQMKKDLDCVNAVYIDETPTIESKLRQAKQVIEKVRNELDDILAVNLE